MLRRVAEILTARIEEVVRGWVADLRRTPATRLHDEMLSAEIVDDMKALLENVADAIAGGVAPSAESAAAAAAAEVLSPRPENVPQLPSDAALPRPEPLLPPVEPQAEDAREGRQPDPARRRLYRATGRPPEGNQATDPASGGEALRRALRAAAREGGLRQSQGYQINEVIQEYVALRRRLWKTLSPELRRTDRAALHLAIYVDEIVDDLLIATTQAYQDAAVRDLEKRAVRDALTDLYNHGYCMERIQEEMRRARRQHSCFTMVMLDLDQLKAINDRYGHLAGDQVLRHVAESMRHAARESDVLCRYAGDEFAIIMPGSDRGQAMVLWERLRAAIRAPVDLTPVIIAGGPGGSGNLPAQIQITASMGVATYPDDARTPEALIAQADAALYRAKAAGRDTIA